MSIMVRAKMTNEKFIIEITNKSFRMKSAQRVKDKKRVKEVLRVTAPASMYNDGISQVLNSNITINHHYLFIFFFQ